MTSPEQSIDASSFVTSTRAPHKGTHSKRAARLWWSGLLLIPAVVLTLAAGLEPNPLGHGTHTQLGLPPCGFLLVTGYPCPGCGLTTSFAHMMNAELVAALRANAFGVLLFVSVVGFMGVAFWGLVRGAPVFGTLERMRADRLALALSVSAIVHWLAVLWKAGFV